MLKNKQEYCRGMISLLEGNNLAVSILFATRDKASGSYEVYKGNLSEEIAQTLKDLCLKISRKSYGKSENKDFRPYNPSKVSSECTEFMEGEEISSLKTVLDLTEGKSVDLKKIDEQFLSHLWFYVIKFDNGQDKIMFFKKYSRGMVLSKGLSLAMLFEIGNFDKLKKDIFVIYDKVDCIYFRQKIIIRSKGNFEKIFGYFERIIENAETATRIIENKLPFKIDDFGKFKADWMKNEIKIRKLNNIFVSGSLERINSANIEALIKEGIIKSVSIKRDSNNNITLVSEDSWEILNILDDDYVQSRLTGIDYLSSYKNKL
jgi:hypothetical protein